MTGFLVLAVVTLALQLGEFKGLHATEVSQQTHLYQEQEEEISFVNPEDGVVLKGTLTLPMTNEIVAAAILLHGSAPLDRDATMLGHKPFFVLANHLAKQGIAVLRFDKRGAGESGGDYNTADLTHFAKDGLAAIEYLKSRKEIDSSSIGLIGHSEGGMTAVLAATQSDDVAFVVSLAAPCVPWDRLILAQEEALQRADHVSEEIIQESLHFRKKVFAILVQESDQKQAEILLRKLFDERFASLPVEHKKIAESYYGPTEAQIAVFNSTWFRYNFPYDPVITLKKLKCPILALNGDRDLVVSSSQNLSRMALALEESGHQDYSMKILPDHNHGMQPCKIGTLAEYAQSSETLSSLVLDEITRWILSRVR